MNLEVNMSKSENKKGVSDAVSNEEIKTKLYAVMAKIFSGHIPTARAVAEDFSSHEADEFINTYYEYLVK